MDNKEILSDKALEKAVGGDSPGRVLGKTDFVYIRTMNRMPGMVVDYGDSMESYYVAFGRHIDSGKEEGRDYFDISNLEVRNEFCY